MLPMERIPYSPMPRRPKLALPNGKRIAVWVLVSIEEWDINSPLPRTVNTPPAGGVPTPDIPNWTWHEYGNRVGFWRLADTLDKFGIKASMAINGVAVKTYAPIAEAARERGWEFAVDDVAVGLSALAVPVLDGDGSIVCALSMAGLTPQMVHRGQPRHLKRLQAAAEAVRARII